MRPRRLLTCSVAALLLGAATPPAADPIADQINAHLDQVQAEGASGVALVSVGNESHVRRGFGWADCEGREAMTADHIVMIGSITKEFTQLLAYVLVEEGKLAFDDPIGKFFPGLPSDKAAITVAELVFHTSGLPDLLDADGRPVPYTVEYDYQPVSREELIRRVGRAGLLFNPGEREEYSNVGYNLLGVLLEIAGGASYEELLRSRIFEPAGMTHTGYVIDDWEELPFAEGCQAGGTRWGSPLVDGMWGNDGPSWNLEAAGGLLSTVDDLARWFGALGSGKLLGPQMQKRYLDQRLAESKFFDQRVMGPAGSNGIFNAVAFWAESSDLRIVIVSTRADHLVEVSGFHRPVIRAAAGLGPLGLGGNGDS